MTDTHDTQDTPTPGTHERLEQLAGMTQEADAANPSAAQQQAAAVEVAAVSAAEQSAREWGILMFTLGGFCSMIAPELKPVYSQERCLDWGRSAAAVGEKYGWNGTAAMPELALIASTAGFVIPSYLVIKGKMEVASKARDGSMLEKLGLWWKHRRNKGAPVAAEVTGAPDGSQ